MPFSLLFHHFPSQAVADTSTHGLLAACCWLLVELVQHTVASSDLKGGGVTHAAWNARYSVIAAGAAGAVIDLDHFAAARSLSLADATSLRSR